MINILYVIWSLGLGGAEQVVISLAKGLDKNKFKPFICCLNDEGRFAEELKAQGVDVFALNKVRGLDFSVVPKLVRIIRENNIHVVHTHLWGANFWGRIAAGSAKVPVVATEHNVDVWKTPIHCIIDRFLFARTVRLIAVSETVKEFYAKKLAVAGQKIRVIYNGVDIKDYERGIGKSEESLTRINADRTRIAANEGRKKIKKELGIGEDEKVIAVIGRLVPQKGHAFFFDALSALPDSGYDIKVLVAGDGPLLQSLKSQVANYKLNDSVKFLGFRKDIPEILGITDILVLPSSREGLPMILLEAMAAGAIVVATSVGGTPELVQDGVNGYLVPFGDSAGLRARLSFVLRGLEAKGDIERVRENAKKTVEEKFSLTKMVARHEELYSGISGKS